VLGWLAHGSATGTSGGPPWRGWTCRRARGLHRCRRPRPPGRVPARRPVVEVDRGRGRPRRPRHPLGGYAFLPDDQAVVTLRGPAGLVLVGPDGAATDVTGPGADELTGPSLGSRPARGGPAGWWPSFGRIGSAGDLALYATAADGQTGSLRRHVGRFGARRACARILTRHLEKAGNHDGGRLASAPTGSSTSHAATPATRRPRRTRPASTARSCASRPDGDPRPATRRGLAVWSLGHRNVQGMGWAPTGGCSPRSSARTPGTSSTVIEPAATTAGRRSRGEHGRWSGLRPAGTPPGRPPRRPERLAVTRRCRLPGRAAWRAALARAADRRRRGTPQALLEGDTGGRA
jgi:hypothetical protein